MFPVAAFYFGLSFGGARGGEAFQLLYVPYCYLDLMAARMFPSDSRRGEDLWAAGEAGADPVLGGSAGSHDFGWCLFVLGVGFRLVLVSFGSRWLARGRGRPERTSLSAVSFWGGVARYLGRALLFPQTIYIPRFCSHRSVDGKQALLEEKVLQDQMLSVSYTSSLIAAMCERGRIMALPPGEVDRSCL